MNKRIRKYKKTYAIFHLTEKHTYFYLGKTRVKVSFTGGVVTKKGVTPATFTTDDPIVQLAIEQSEDFKKGAIKVRSQYPLDGNVNVGYNGQQEEGGDPSLKLGSLDKKGDAAERLPQETALEVVETAESLPQETALEVVETAESLPQETALEVVKTAESLPQETALEVVEVSCKDVAKQYLQEHYGENPAPLRTRDAVQECAAKYGITFNFV